MSQRAAVRTAAAKVAAAHGHTPPPRVYKRTLPWVNPGPVVVPGVGAFAVQSVGNTSHSTALHVYFHAEDEEEARMGLEAYRLELTDDLAWRWVHEPRGRHSVHSPTPDAILREMQIAVNGWRLVDPTGYFFHVLSCVEMEQQRIQYEIQKVERSIANFTEFLADPTMPRPWKDRLGAVVTISIEERTTRRVWWRDQLARSERKLENLHHQHDGRLAILKMIRDGIRVWSKRDHDPAAGDAGRPFLDVLEETMAMARAYRGARNSDAIGARSLTKMRASA